MNVLNNAVKLSETLYTEAQKLISSDTVSYHMFVISKLIVYSNFKNIKHIM